MNFFMIDLLLREASDNLRVRLNVYLVSWNKKNKMGRGSCLSKIADIIKKRLRGFFSDI